MSPFLSSVHIDKHDQWLHFYLLANTASVLVAWAMLPALLGDGFEVTEDRTFTLGFQRKKSKAMLDFLSN